MSCGNASLWLSFSYLQTLLLYACIDCCCVHNSCITHVYMLKLSGDLINSKTCSASASLQIIKNQAQFTNNNNKPEGKEDDHLVEMSARSATIPKIVLLEMCNWTYTYTDWACCKHHSVSEQLPSVTHLVTWSHPDAAHLVTIRFHATTRWLV